MKSALHEAYFGKQELGQPFCPSHGGNPTDREASKVGRGKGTQRALKRSTIPPPAPNHPHNTHSENGSIL